MCIMKLILLILTAYLLGSIPTGLWIGQYFYNINLREHGSGNTGTTNTFRILGLKAGAATLLIDIFKGTLATLLPVLVGATNVSPIAIGFFAVLGHTFPIFAGFKGGKAVATSAGVLDRKSTRLNSSHANISYAVFCLKKKRILTTSTFLLNY